VKLLLVAESYPHRTHSFAGVATERNALALCELGEQVAVLAPRPYAPPIVGSLSPRWRLYGQIPSDEARHGIPVLRPAYPQLPRIAGALCFEVGGHLFSRRSAWEMHRRTGFDAILGFDLAAGGVAWRLGRNLGIPACGWAFGSDVRVRHSPLAVSTRARTLRRLDLVFYQSHELREEAANLLGMPLDRLAQDRHIVLPHGIPEPPALRREEVRKQIRTHLAVADDGILVVSLGRILGQKGIYELLEALSFTSAHHPRLDCVIVGSMPGLDETEAVQAVIGRTSALRGRVRVIAACAPERVWAYLCAADLFAFASHHEGMPNSLLEAMVMGVPAVAFSIPPVREIEGGTGALHTVPLADTKSFADSILRLAASPEERARVGARGRARVLDAFLVERNMARAVDQITRVVEARRTPELESLRRQ
jgi:glycosyltransferase involved in cell wall biosynthesis